MSRQIIPLYYERSVDAWLKLRFPQIKATAIIPMGHNVHHVLVSASEAQAIRVFVTKDLSPPVKRRTLDPAGTVRPNYEPGLCFEYYNATWPIEVSKATIAAYTAVLPHLETAEDVTYVQGRIASLKATSAA